MAEQPKTARRPRWKTCLFVGALAAVVLTVCASGFEVVLRVLYREEEIFGRYWAAGAFVADEELGFRHAPGFSGRAFRDGAFDCPVEIQANGLRQADYEVQVRYPRRLLILGDSFAFGVGVAEENAFPSLIQPPLNSAGIGVINGAQTSYCTAQEVGWGRRLVETVKPDAVVLCLFTENDVIGDYYQRYENVEVVYGRRLRKDRRLPIAAVDYLRTHSYAWMFGEHRFRRQARDRGVAEYQRLAVFHTKEFVQPTLDALTGFDEFCRQRGISFGIVMIPSAGNAPFDAPLKRTFREAGIPYIHLPGAGLGAEHRFQGDAHWNERGHREAAKYIAPFCLRLLRDE